MHVRAHDKAFIFNPGIQIISITNIHMQPIEILGYIAGTMSSLVFLPQVIKTWKTKSASDISLVMFLFATASVVMWLVYGIIIKNGSIIYTNSTVLLLSCIMLYFKLKYK